jgi:hypothetical protein
MNSVQMNETTVQTALLIGADLFERISNTDIILSRFEHLSLTFSQLLAFSQT